MRNMQNDLIEEIDKNLRSISKNTVQALQAILKEVEKQEKFDKSFIDGLKGIILHIEEGGRVKTTSFPTAGNANELFKNMLKDNGVMFVSFKTKDPDNETIITLDKDARIVEDIRSKLLQRIFLMKGELSPNDFLNKYIDDDIRTIRGLDLAEIEYFRHKVKKDNDYTVILDEKEENKYILVYPSKDAKSIENTMNRVIFEFSATDGLEKKNNFENALYNRSKVLKDITEIATSGKTLIIADSINPATFIKVSEAGITLHNLRYEADPSNDYKNNEYIHDEIINCDDLSKLGFFMDKLVKPVIFKESEFRLVKGYDSKGNAIVNPKDFLEDIDICRAESLKFPSDRHYTAGYDLFKLNNPMLQDIFTYTNIPKHLIPQFEEYIRSHGLRNTVIKDGVIACAESDKRIVDEFMQINVYQEYIPDENTAFTPIIDYEVRFNHENRGPLVLSDIDKMPKQQFIIDNSNLCFLFEISPEGLRVYNSGGMYLDIKNNVSKDSNGNIIRDHSFDETLLTVLNNMDNPILLDASEVIDKTQDEIIQAIYNHRAAIYSSEAVSELRDAILRGNDTEFESMFVTKPEDRSEKQKAAIERIEELKGKSVDKSINEQPSVIKDIKEGREREENSELDLDIYV